VDTGSNRQHLGTSGLSLDSINLRCRFDTPVHFQFTVYFDITHLEPFQFAKADIPLLRILIITVQDSVSPEQVVPVVFSYIPVTAADEKVEIDQLVFQFNILCLVQVQNS
jgi:hypothetical protein